VEKPRDSLQDLAGIVAEGQVSASPPVELDASVCDESTAKELSDLPWSTLLPNVVELRNATVSMRIGGRPAVAIRRLGKGHVISILFEMSRQILELQQGKPASGFRVSNLRGHSEVYDTPDLAASDSMVGSTTPFADVLERFLAATIERCLPLPRPWYFPYEYDGVGLMTHDEDWFGDKSIFISRQEASQNYSSTFFIIPSGPTTREGLRKIQELGTDVQIHWNRETERWFIIFKKQEGSLEKQIQVTREKSGKRPTICRIERLRWGRSFTRPFRIMEAQGLALDSSYGPAGHRGKGYIFGTGLPFHPIDTNGLPFKIYELPIQVQVRYSGANVSFIALLMNQSRWRYHEAINVLYHPVDLLEGQPARYDWLQFSRIARQNNHALMTMTEFMQWWRDRRSITISNLIWNGTTLRFRCLVPRDDCAVFVPIDFSGGTIRSVEIDSASPKSSRDVTVQGTKYLVIRLDKGDHFACISYG